MVFSSVYMSDDRIWPFYPLGKTGFDRSSEWWPDLTVLPPGYDRIWPFYPSGDCQKYSYNPGWLLGTYNTPWYWLVTQYVMKIGDNLFIINFLGTIYNCSFQDLTLFLSRFMCSCQDLECHFQILNIMLKSWKWTIPFYMYNIDDDLIYRLYV